MNLYENMNLCEIMDTLNSESSMLLETPFNISVNDFYKEDFDNLDNLIANAKRIILFRHIGADQDAIAAVASMKVLIDKKYPKKEVIISKEKNNFANLTDEDLVIIMDVGESQRIAGSYFGTPKTARIDHHKTGMICDVTIEDVNAGSTAELLTLFYNQKDYPLDKKVCELLFKGIISDTGRMQYSLSPSTIAALGIIQSYKIDYKNIYNQMYSKSPASIKARKYILNNFLTTEHGVAYLFIDSKKALAAGVNINDVTSMPYELENMEGHPIWMIAAQRKDGIYIRLRSRGIDIRELAKKYNGGGHMEACGIKLANRKELTKFIDDCDDLLVKKSVIVESDNNEIKEVDKMTGEKEEYLVKYDQYLESHIGCVQQAYQYIKDNIPEILNDVEDLASLDKQISQHDESKYSEEEYEAYALYFNVSKEKYINEFNRAWNHHQKTNPHHWQYWVLIEDEEDEKYIPIEIPYNYIIEMICDWWAFSFKKNDLSEILSWYEDHKDKMIINPESKKQIENILNKISSILQPNAIKEDVLIEKQWKTFADGGRICPYCGEVLDPGEHHKCEPKKEKTDTKPSNTAQPAKNKPEQKTDNHPSRDIKPGDPDDKNYTIEEPDDERTHKNYLHESKIPTKTKQLIYKLNTEIKNKYGTAVAKYVMAEVNKGNLEDLDDIQRKIQMLKSNGGIDPRTGKKIPMKPQQKTINEDGHLSKDMSVEDIAKKHNVSVEELEKQVKMGIDVEHEHTSDDEEAKRIALDHLFEIPDYYTRLKKMEEEGEKALQEDIKEWTKMTQEERESAKKNGDLFTLKGKMHTISPDGHARPIESKPVKTKINEDSLLDNAEILTEGWRGLIRKIIKGDSKHRWIDTSNADRADLEIAYNESYNYLKKILVKLKSLDVKKLNNVTNDNYDNAKKALDTGTAQIESIIASSKKIYKTHNVEDMRKAVTLLDLYIMKLVPQSAGNNIRFYDSSKGQSAKDVTTNLRESVLDPINKERCPEIFKDNKMISSVRKFIIDIVNDFKKQVNFDFKVKNIYMIGSSTGFQYSLTSDIDIEVETSIKKSQIKNIINIIPKGTLLPGTNKPINIFIINDDESYDFKQAENVYDLVKDKWLKQSEKSDYQVPYQYVKDLSQFFMNGCDLTLSKFEQDKKEMEEYLSLDPKTQEINDNEKADAISRKIIDLKNDIDALTMAHHVVFAFEKEGYENMPFRVRIEMEKKTDPRYSINNLVYKMVDRFGYFEKINNAKKEAIELVKKAENYGTNK